MITTEMKIQGILNHGFDVPSIFKSVLRKESCFTKDEEIIDVILIERESFNKQNTEPNVYSKAELLIATSHGLILIEEGLDETDINHLGYKILHTTYNKIACIELDVCCLLGIFRIAIYTSNNNEIEVKFNTAKYRESFETFIDVVRNRMIDCTTNR